MKSYSYLRSLIRTSVCVAASLAALVSRGTAAGPQQAQAQLLDHAELLCANCFFGTSYYYSCFAADNKVLIGYQKTRVLNWEDESKNYLTKVHRGWTAWTAPGQTVPLSYDDEHIWVTRANGKQVKLTQSYSRDIFTNNEQCRDAARAKAH
jgi:hypothetical protein